MDEKFLEKLAQANPEDARKMLYDLTGMGQLIGGDLYKPDASPTAEPCARCGNKRAAWIGGAGQALCVRHQDDY